MALNITIKCQKCTETGVYYRSSTGGEGGVSAIDPCPSCLGTGTLVLGSIDIKEITDELARIKKDIKKILKNLSLPVEE